MSKKIAVVGGGTAGWMSALMAQTHYPSCTVTLIESNNIGILGAGEGTTPHFINFLDEVRIPITDIAKECKLSFKFGINFENWTDGGSYYHAFNTNQTLDPFAFEQGAVANFAQGHEVHLDQFQIQPQLNNSNKALATFKDSYLNAGNKIFSVDFLSQWGVHFDARLLADALKRIGISRGIVHIEDEVKDTEVVNGNITSLILSNDVKISTDFVFDCSGFRREFIGKLFKSEWHSYSDFLPMKSAVPFFIEHDNDVPAMTSAIAMDYGWIWKIPVQGRYGCGYVFDSDYINKDQALEEASKLFGQEIKSDKVFSFNAGCYKDVMIGNCVAIGLSQGFVEPLEATSLWVSYMTLKDLMHIGIFADKTEEDVKHFNKLCFDRNSGIADFIHIHYLGQKKSSPFWTEFSEKNKTPDSAKEIIEKYKRGTINSLQNPYFSELSYSSVLSGVGFKCGSNFRPKANTYMVRAFLNNQQRLASQCMSHKCLMDWLSNEDNF